MAHSVVTALMFQGTAEQAMNRYVALFKGAIAQIERYAPGEPQPGTIKRAHFSIAGQQFMCFDSPMKHDFTFTPAASIFVECEGEAELDRAFEQLSGGGQVLMPLGNYGFSTRFGWLNDSFGVSWQLNLR